MWWDLPAEAATPRAELVAGIGGGAVRSYATPIAVHGRGSVFLGDRWAITGTGLGLPGRAEIVERLTPACIEEYWNYCATVKTYPSDEPTAAGALSAQWTPVAGGAWVADEFPLGVRLNVSAGLGAVRRREYGVGQDTWAIPQDALYSRVQMSVAGTAAVGLDLSVGPVVIAGEARAFVWHAEPRRYTSPGEVESPWAAWLVPTVSVGGRWSSPARTKPPKHPVRSYDLE